jgi:putative transposase
MLCSSLVSSSICFTTNRCAHGRRKKSQTLLASLYATNFEKLDTMELIENGHLARSISDTSWSLFNQKLAYKAESAGKLYLQVDARGTSQTCPVCGRVEGKSLSQRYHDYQCGCMLTQDYVSSLVILYQYERCSRNDRNLRLWTSDLY